jgi:Protein of unknown function (DUF2628)/Putative prokaryotic signal transducing protein
LYERRPLQGLPASLQTNMTRTPEELAQYYRTLSEAELTRLRSSGGLLPEAAKILEEELRQRGLAAPVLVEDAPSPTPADMEYLGDWVTVTKGLAAPEANLLKSCLEAANIPAQVAGQHSSNLLGALVLDARLRVPAAFEDEARATLEQFKRGELRMDETALEQASLASTVRESALAIEGKPTRLRTYYVYAVPGSQVPLVVGMGFSWGAFLFPPIWFLLNRMWLTVVVWLMLLFGLRVIHTELVAQGWMTEIRSMMWFAGVLCLQLLIGFYANSLLILSREAKGHKQLAKVQAENAEHARELAEVKTTC